MIVDLVNPVEEEEEEEKEEEEEEEEGWDHSLGRIVQAAVPSANSGDITKKPL